MKAVFLDARQLGDKGAGLLRSAPEPDALVHVADIRKFRLVPRSPLCYWVPDSLRAPFAKFDPVKTGTRQAWSGATTMDDFRHARTWFELPAASTRSDWPLFSKGGQYQRYYLPLYLCVDWRLDGREMKARISFLRESRGHGPQWTAVLNGYKKYLEPGLYWSRRSLKGLTVRILPAGAIFSDKSPSLMTDRHSELLPLLAVMNSSTFRYLVSMQMTFGSFEVGVVNRTPVPDLDGETAESLAGVALRGWSLRRALDAGNEVSHAFVEPAILQVGGDSFSDRVKAWAERLAGLESELDRLQSATDDMCCNLYGISDEDQKVVNDGFGVTGDGDADSEADEDENEDDQVAGSDPGGLAAGLMSWAVGVATGRFDVRLATGQREWPADPDPFDPLPMCSPAMLTGDEGVQASVPPPGYPLQTSSMLVDDPGHDLDITARVRTVFDVVFGTDSDRWWSDVAPALGGEVDRWMRTEFFDYHLKTYSKSRRKAPILWSIGTRSGSYQVWVYAHRVSSDTLFQILNDLVAPKVMLEEQELTRLRQDAGPDPAASQRKVIDAQEGFVGELHALRETIERVAPLWAPDLNDGIVIVLAPLWELFAHNRAWSRELKKHWEKLLKGEYDWAQLAMHLWPERVIPKCAEDRSLAIAHGLEAVFWRQEDTNDDKWHPREHPTTPVEELVTKRRNPAVAAALNQLVNA